jgi:hypothetical protein
MPWTEAVFFVCDSSVLTISENFVLFLSRNRGIDHHSIVGEAAIGRTLERMNNSFRPLALANGTQLKNRATAQAALTSRSIKISSYVKKQDY